MKIRFIDWLRQPSTLTGLSLLIGGVSGLLTGAFHADIATPLLLAALPKLLPDNTTVRTVSDAVVPAVVNALDRKPGNTPAKNP